MMIRYKFLLRPGDYFSPHIATQAEPKSQITGGLVF